VRFYFFGKSEKFRVKNSTPKFLKSLHCVLVRTKFQNNSFRKSRELILLVKMSNYKKTHLYNKNDHFFSLAELAEAAGLGSGNLVQ